MRRHFNDQYFSGNRLREVGAPAAATDAANKAYVDGIGIAVYHFDWGEHDEGVLTDRDGNTVGPQAIAGSADAGKTVLLETGGRCYALGRYDMSGSPQEMVFVAVDFSAGHGAAARLDYLYYNSDDGWDGDNIGLQERLESGTNIKTVGGLSLLGSGNLTLPGTLFYGITNTAEATAEKVVALTNPTTGFANGSCLLLHFTYGVPAGYGNAVSVGGVSYALTYHQYGITTAGVINAGDKVLLYCYNAVAHVIAIDRWGADIAGKQDALVASGANQNIKTINSTTLLGSGNITLLPTHTLHTTTIATAGSTTTVTCAANERAFHIVEVTAANCTLNIDILNGWDNTVYISGNQNINIVFKVNGASATTIFEMHNQFAGLTAILSKAGAMKFVVEVVDNKVFVDVDAMDTITVSKLNREYVQDASVNTGKKKR